MHFANIFDVFIISEMCQTWTMLQNCVGLPMTRHNTQFQDVRKSEETDGKKCSLARIATTTVILSVGLSFCTVTHLYWDALKVVIEVARMWANEWRNVGPVFPRLIDRYRYVPDLHVWTWSCFGGTWITWLQWELGYTGAWLINPPPARGFVSQKLSN